MAKSTARFLSVEEIGRLKSQLQYNYLKRFKVLFLSVFNFENFEYGEANYVMDRIFNGLNVASFRLNTIVGAESPCAFQGFIAQNYDLYSRPVKVRIENMRNDARIPNSYLLNNADAVLFMPQLNYYLQINPLIDLLVDVDMTIRTNLKLHKMPFIISSTSDRTKKAINDVLDDKFAVALDDDTTLRSGNTNTPYIIDKLEQYKIAVESRILSIIGIKGQKMEKMAQMTVDEVNNNEEEINGFKNQLFDALTLWLDKTNEIFGTNYLVKLNDHYEDSEEVEEIEDESI